MRLFKAHGLGNDYLVLEEGPELGPASVVALCDRHRGPGADGVLEPRPSSRADHGVRIWNPDGSVAEKSGNGLRIFACWCAAQGAPPRFTVDTGHEVVGCTVEGWHATLEMGHVRFLPLDAPPAGAELPRAPDGTPLELTALRIGNPHAVLWTSEPDLDALPWRTWGPALESDRTRFPDRTNVQLARSVGPGHLEARIWERGAGETLASGSSACAVAAVAVRRNDQPADQPIRVEMPGGDLEVTVRHDGSVQLAGPVAPVGHFTLHPCFQTA